jgi:hypothetical protein
MPAWEPDIRPCSIGLCKRVIDGYHARGIMSPRQPLRPGQQPSHNGHGAEAAPYGGTCGVQEDANGRVPAPA